MRVPRWILRAIAAQTVIVLALVTLANTLGGHDPRTRAIILMGDTLVLVWVVAGGALMWRYRDAVRAWMARVPLRWEVKFVLFATGLALVEEAVTTSLTNLAPEYGSQVGVAYITASNNYLIVIAFSSVVVFVPEFVGWMLLLRRYDFTPNEVLLLYGLLGTTMEGSINPSSLLAGFWFFVYGLMVYLPAYCLPPGRPVQTPRWYHYVLTYVVPLAVAIPVVVVDTLAGRALGIHLWTG